ncbi:MAG: GntR family transcriptional regulator [Lachnospiraceae bacterium]|jgi:DNA-binding transcriptional regulator YhcF (GntR family)|nr:GntR family transcriptional regulator [Lachnospiraceae bacterium]
MWELNNDRAIYAQLVEMIQTDIVSGKYSPGDKLPSVRDLAAQAQVNPNTMQKAFTELERSGLIVTQRTNGRSVTQDPDLIQAIRTQMAKEQLGNFCQTMSKLGYSEGEILTLVSSSGERAALV